MSLPFHRPDFDVRRRAFALVALWVLHAGFLIILLAPSKEVPQPVPTIVLHSRAIPAQRPLQPIDSELLMNPHITAPTVEFAAPAAIEAAAKPCVVLDALSAALQADPDTAAALVPVAGGSSHALMAWDGHWAVSSATSSIRKVVIATITAETARCRDENLVGPRLIFIPVSGTTISIAIGSGTWRWDELLSSN